MADDIRIVSPMIMEVRASFSADVVPHVYWSVGYAPEVDDDGERFLLAHLHAAGDEGYVEVEVAATLLGGFDDIDDANADEFERALADADALDVIYQLASITARSLSGTIDADIPLGRVAPPVELTRLVRADAADES